MRTVLTIVAVALVAVMSVALIAPYLIDWSAQRAEIEARLSAITGANVSLTGPVELRLLPTPYLALGEGLVSAPGPDGAKLSFASARLELALVKLASGQIRFSDIRLEKPVLTLTRGPDGALKLPPLRMAGLHSTGFDRLIVRDGRVKIVGAAAGTEISGVEIDAAAPSLDGPARLSGQFSGPGQCSRRLQARLGKARVRKGRRFASRWTQVRAGLPPNSTARSKATRPPGLAAFGSPASATLTGTAPGEDAPTPWRVAGPIDRRSQSGDHATGGISSRTGGTRRSGRTGTPQLVFGSPAQISVALKAKQVNVDSLMRRKGEDGVAPARAVDADHPHRVGGASGPREPGGDRRPGLRPSRSSLARRRCPTRARR